MKRPARRTPASASALAFAAALVLSLLLGAGCTRDPEIPDEASSGAAEADLGPPAVVFAPAARDPKATVVVPTLDTPMPEKVSVLWCGSFELAWKELQKNFGPIKLSKSREVADRLDRARFSADNLPVGSFYVASGDGSPESVSKAIQGLEEKFPARKVPDLSPGALMVGPFALAYLRAGLTFTTPFQVQSLEFRDIPGKLIPVAAFGIPGHGGKDASALRKQVAVLYSSDLRQEPEAILDLCRDSRPCQLIVATVPREDTLAKTMARLEKFLSKEEEPIQEGEELKVPDLGFLLEHRFQEIECPELALAYQSIRFELNRFGAKVESMAVIAEGKDIEKKPRDFVFDRPFLIYLRKRSADRPLLVLWVENAEILRKK